MLPIQAIADNIRKDALRHRRLLAVSACVVAVSILVAVVLVLGFGEVLKAMIAASLELLFGKAGGVVGLGEAAKAVEEKL